MFKTKVEKPSYVKVTKGANNVYLILVGYEVKEVEPVVNDNYASIDLGVNNLATVTFTNGKPFIVNGRPLKSINQYYNKRLAELQTRQDNYINSVEAVDKNKAKSISKRTNLMNAITNYDCETRLKTLTTDKSFIKKDGYFVDDNGNVFFPRDLQRTLIKFKNTGTSKNFANFCELLCSVYDLMRKSSPEKFTEEDFANEKKEMYLSSSSLFALDKTEAYWKLSKRLSNKMKELNIKLMK